MENFKLVCTGFWADGEVDGYTLYDATFAVVNSKGETVLETGRTGWDYENLCALDGVECDKNGRPC